MRPTISRLRPLCPECAPYSTWQCCDRPVPREYVYFAHIGPYVKVGFSKQPDTRLDQLTGRAWGALPHFPRFHPDSCQEFHPFAEPVHSLHVVEVKDGRHGEQDAHRALEGFAVEGEWFIAEPALLAWVSEQQSGTGFARLARDGGGWVRERNEVELAEFERLRDFVRSSPVAQALDELFPAASP